MVAESIRFTKFFIIIFNNSYDLNNRLLTEVQTAGNQSVTTTYTYDAAGNQKTKTSTDPDVPAETRAYTASGQLAAVNVGTTYTAYSYWPSGLRLSKGADAFVWDGANLAYESGSDTYYLYGTSLFAAKESTADRYYLFNGHGDVIQLANSTGTVTKTYEYDAYGNEKNPDSTDTNCLRYCGEYYDSETGPSYLRARYYNPRLGRFASEDPARSGLNWYTYCAGNPITFVDPSGCVIDLLGTTDDKDITLAYLQMTTDYYLQYDIHNHVIITGKQSEENHPEGNTLIKDLISEEKTVYISVNHNKSFSTVVNSEYISISYDPLYTPYLWEEDLNYTIYNMPDDAYAVYNEETNEYIVIRKKRSSICVALVHELIHADRYYKGLYNIYQTREEPILYRINQDGDIVGFKYVTDYYDPDTKTKSISLEELSTVGLYGLGENYSYNGKRSTTENKIRAELGLPQRGRYSVL